MTKDTQLESELRVMVIHLQQAEWALEKRNMPRLLECIRAIENDCNSARYHIAKKEKQTA